MSDDNIKPPATIVDLEEDIILTDEAKERVVKCWNSKPSGDAPSFDELMEAAWQKKNLDVRSKYGLLIKEFIAQRIKKKKPDSLELTSEQKLFIDNNKNTMGALEIARELFNNNNLTPLNKESRLVIDYYNKSNQTVFTKQQYVDGPYSPPEKLQDVIALVKKYITSIELDVKNLTARQRQGLISLSNYLNTMRFITHANSFEDEQDRALFISEFVRCCFDKPDLSEEEVDQYIVYSNEVIISKNISRSIDKFQRSLEDSYDTEDGKRMSMTLVEMIGKMREEYNQSISRQTRLLSDLKGTRAKRIERQGKESASIINLVQAWKDEEFRKKTIHLAERRKEVLSQGVDAIVDMDDFKARVFGLSKNEVLEG